MKKFLFTLAALLMAVSAYAECYIYIDANDFEVTAEDIALGTEIDIPVRAHFSARASGFEWSAVYPEGMTVVFMEKGADCDVQGYNSRGRATTFNAALYGVVEPYDHIVGTLADNGYWQNPDSENPTAWVTYGVAKWEAGDYEEFLLITAVFDENYHGGEIITTTSCSSGRDERGGTVADNGDQSQFFSHSSGELEDPQPAVVQQPVAAPEIATSMDDDYVYVTITWPTTDGNQVYTGQDKYARPEYGQPDESYQVEAYTTETEAYEESEHATATVNVPAKDPVWIAVDAPEIETTMDDNNVYVNIIWPETTGNHVYTGQYTYARPEYGQPAESYNVEAYTEADYPYEESEHETATIPVPAKAPVWQDVVAPVISYSVGETTVTVTIEWPETTGEHVYTGQYTYDRPAYGEGTGMYEVEAYTTESYPYRESTHAYLTIFVPELAQQQTAKPTITYSDNGEGIVVTATGEGEIKLYVEDELVATGTGSASYTIPYSTYPEGEVVAVSATAQAEGEAISDYAIAEVEVPYKPVVVEKIDVDAPVITTEMDANYVYVDIEWPETDGTHYYNGQAYYERLDEDYSVDVEAYTGETDTYNESEHATMTVVVPAKEPVAMKTYVKVTALDQIVAGKKYIFVAADYAMGEIVNGFGTPVELTGAKAADEVMAPATIEFTLGGESGAWTFEQNGQYLLGTNGTSLAMGDNVNAAKWNINNNNGALTGYRARNAQYDTRSVKKHNTMARFGNYANSDTNSEFALLYVEKEEAPVVLDPTDSPSIAANNHYDPVYNDEGEQIGTENGWYEVKVTATEGGELQYRYQYEDGEWSDWMPYVEDENGVGIAFTEEGHYVVEARERAEGKDWSQPVQTSFTVTAKTSIYELNGEKAVASVRYFNLAGQEMQEANGMTIVVTTYTDGTTSAVKVMK